MSNRRPEDTVGLGARLFRARTLRVHSAQEITVELDLWFGVRTVQRFRVEGIDVSAMSQQDREDVKSAMILTLGGKDVLMQATEPPKPETQHRSDPPPLARVYYDYDFKHEPPHMVDVLGRGVQRVEVAGFMSHLAQYAHDKTLALAYMKGKQNPDNVMARHNKG